MSQYYKPQRTRNLFNPKSKDSFRISRSKIDLFLECPRCFYLDRRLGVARPPGFPFAINSAVDKLLKKEFDIHRANGSQHPLQKKYRIDAKPVAHEELNIWQENFKGVQVLHRPTNFTVTGAIDDLWQNSKGQYIVVDYKATSKAEEITELDKDWQDGYKRQMEVYQWLLRQKGYKVSDSGYFVYCNGRTDVAAFDGKVEFEITLIEHQGDDSWVEPTLKKLHTTLTKDKIPAASKSCDYCNYRKAVSKVE